MLKRPQRVRKWVAIQRAHIAAVVSQTKQATDAVIGQHKGTIAAAGDDVLGQRQLLIFEYRASVDGMLDRDEFDHVNDAITRQVGKRL